MEAFLLLDRDVAWEESGPSGGPACLPFIPFPVLARGLAVALPMATAEGGQVCVQLLLLLLLLVGYM